MKLRTSLLCLAIASAFAAPAFAQSRSGSTTTGSTQVSNDINVAGNVAVRGYIQVDAEGGSNVNQTQTATGAGVGGGAYLGAAVGDTALYGSSGNIGVNVSSGASNVQANDASIVSLTMRPSDDIPGTTGTGANSTGVRRGALASAMVFNTQDSHGNFATTNNAARGAGTGYLAALNGDALGAVSGNVGVNIAAGAGNAQGNASAITAADGAAIAKASSVSDQVAYDSSVSGSAMDADFVASFGGGALAGATGNLQVNLTAGAGNVQHNGLAIASSTTGAGNGTGGGG